MYKIIQKNNYINRIRTINTFIISVIFYTCCLTTLSCHDNLVGPAEDKPGRRDYIWSVDTIKVYSRVNDVWGSAHDDIWAINDGSPASNRICHFDGYSWRVDESFSPYAPCSIWGLNKNNVYIGGMSGWIMKFDGNKWSEAAILKKDGNKQIVFDGLWGESENNIYAFGGYTDKDGLANNSVLAQYTDEWKVINTDVLHGIIERFYKNEYDGRYYLRTNFYGLTHPDSTFLYEYYGNGAFNKIYSSIYSQGKKADIFLADKQVYFILGQEISTRVNNQFHRLFTIDNPKFYQRAWGRSSKDIFLLMTDGIAHYNGTDIQYLFLFNNPDTYSFAACIFENEVFFLVEDPYANLVYRGILKNNL